MKKIASKISKTLKKSNSGNVVVLNDFRKLKTETETFFEELKSDGVENLDPLHAYYVRTLNILSGLGEILQTINEPSLNKLFNIVADAGDEYMPQAPPMSPITTSYFNTWLLFDVATGIDKESIGSIVIELSREYGLDGSSLRVMEILQQSRMGIYEFLGKKNGRIFLKELMSDEAIECICPSGYPGLRLGELWFARIMPPLSENFDYSVVMTTPYILVSHGKNGWLEYLNRTITGKKTNNSASSYAGLMKYGLNQLFWPEYIFQAYSDFRPDAIFLTGLPDVTVSRPHGDDTTRTKLRLPSCA